MKGPKTDAVILNAGAAIYVASDDLTIEEAIEIARKTIANGTAKKQLERFIAKSQAE